MTRITSSSKARWPSIAYALGLSLLVTMPADAQVVRDFESSRGVVKVTVLPVAEMPAPQEGDTTAVPVPALPPAPAATFLDSISDFTSLAQLVREADGEMEVYFLDRHSSEELRFPLRYSELRRILLLNPIAYDQATVAERNVALFADLAGALLVQMVEPSDVKEKP